MFNLCFKYFQVEMNATMLACSAPDETVTPARSVPITVVYVQTTVQTHSAALRLADGPVKSQQTVSVLQTRLMSMTSQEIGRIILVGRVIVTVVQT